MHGLHVIVGMVFISISVLRLIYDPYIRIEGLVKKIKIENNLKKYFNVRVLIRKNIQNVSGRYLIHNFIIKKALVFNKLQFYSLFPNLFKTLKNDKLIILFLNFFTIKCFINFILCQLNKYHKGLS